MTRPPPHELVTSGRPVRSDYARERSYALRRMITLGVLAVIVCGAGYGVWRHHSSAPGVIPTIKSEGAYKQKPAQPGGIDIPHQDVRVYDELEGKNAPPTSEIEHLLPQPEIPQDVPHTTVTVTPPQQASLSAPDAPPVMALSEPALSPQVTVPSKDVLGLSPAAAKSIVTTVAPASVPALTSDVTVEVPVASNPTASPQAEVSPPKTEGLTIDQVIAQTKSSAGNAVTTNAQAESGNVAVQLASSNDPSKAQEMATNLQKKYASVLGDAQLTLNRADLGSRGIFYRIQSQSLSEDEANHICSSLKQMNAGCILVRK